MLVPCRSDLGQPRFGRLRPSTKNAKVAWTSSKRVSNWFLRRGLGTDTTEDRCVGFASYKLHYACLPTRSLAAAKVRTGSSRTCSFFMADSNPFSNTATFERSRTKTSGDWARGAVRFAPDNSRRVKILMIIRERIDEHILRGDFFHPALSVYIRYKIWGSKHSCKCFHPFPPCTRCYGDNVGISCMELY